MGFSQECFARRREELRTRLSGGAMILPAAPVHTRAGDTDYRYRPDSELFYVSGSVDPDVIAVIRDSGEEGFVLFVPGRDPEAERWTGPRMGPEEARERLAADAAYTLKELETRLPAILEDHRRVFFRLGVDSRVETLVVQSLRWARARGSRRGRGPRMVVDPGQILDEMRLVKDQEEVERIRRATSLTVSGFVEVISGARPGLGEWEMEAGMEAHFRRGGGSGPAFPSIVASGSNGCTLHYVDNHATVGPGELVLLDAGAEVDLYAGDVTRTFPVSRRFTEAQRDAYGVVLRGHRAALSAIRPGSSIAEVHRAACAEIVLGLKELGVLEGDPEELLKGEAYKEYFPHQTSHWLGLNVHDVGDYALTSGTRTLEPGMVFTVEPGLYFPLQNPEAGHAFAGLGIRIEDDLLVTEDGFENLTAHLPVDTHELEALVGSGLKGALPGPSSGGTT